MPVKAIHLGISSVVAMGVAVTAFGVSSPPSTGAPAFQTVVYKLVVPSSAGISLDTVQRSFVVNEGDTLERLLLRGGAADGEFLDFITHHEDASRLLELQPGEQFHASIDSIGRVHELRYSLGEDDLDLASGEGRRLVIQRGIDGLKARVETIALIRTSRIGYSRVVSSLFAATHGAGIPDKVASQIVDVLGGEIDFERDIRQGDELRVIYETLTEPDRLDVEYAGRLLAVELSGRGKSYNALWLEQEKGHGQYYDFQGRSASRSFLRYPIEYARISSGFSSARMHPVFGRKQAHLGVDFVAPPGTRIRASGEGVVEFVGTQRGYGRVVILRHNKGISTVYAHMRGFAKGVKKNTKVARGDVIGYVGASGWATGPHLHYEYRIGGHHRNPLSVDLPEEAPLTAKAKIHHSARAEQLRAQLNQIETVQVAGRFE